VNGILFLVFLGWIQSKESFTYQQYIKALPVKQRLQGEDCKMELMLILRTRRYPWAGGSFWAEVIILTTVLHSRRVPHIQRMVFVSES
jgi:hypothetical protein